ncbi:hypothetical protein Bca52824_071476 [Brassica carinata]|uniref:Uncharacterized protein n=1 Tax=Brassica carinata TaxID=52824 RepID=A0A8X7Q6S5_BRACI|nr:hypothetical protein Bca52824_071476 [Brassica carinata]
MNSAGILMDVQFLQQEEQRLRGRKSQLVLSLQALWTQHSGRDVQTETMMHVVKILRLLVAVSNFRIALLLAAVGNPLWGLGDLNKAPAYDQQPHSTSFFSDKRSWEIHGSGVSLCGKLPLLYQWHKLRPHPSELYSSNGHGRYEAIAEIFANQ